MARPNIDETLLPQLIAAFASYPTDVVTLARVERKARDIATRDPFIGATLLGACAAAKGDAASARQHHETALRLAPNDLAAWTNYMVSLSILGDADTARAQAFAMGAKFPGNPIAVRCATNALTELGLLQSVGRFHQQHNAHGARPEWADVVDPLLSKHGLEECHLTEAVLGARGFLARAGLVRAEFTCEFIEDDVGGPGWLAYGFKARAGVETVHALQDRLFVFLVDRQFPAESCGAISFFIGVAHRGDIAHASAAD